MMMYVYVAAGFVLLLGGAEIMVRGAVGLAEKLKISKMLIGMTVVAFGTSAPELLVSLNATLSGSSELAIGNLVGSNIATLIEDLFRDEICIDKIENLSAITVKLPNDNVKTPGIYYFIFQRLSWEGVNINEVISTSNEFTILMDEDSVNVAFEVIKNLKSL